ncbi:VWA domain-containing protein [Brevibacterium gallinarum]|uniref:VWA domain-containing protein n=1 Tax=Brevibacterium gallinarum TaxID=2762220 RepID=A0ABR8WS45_9MICO|nr:VWA domain-containing protein [Brevibacterium gallinarum]MBD8019506.1 VWA domain-containing protein [Brevibacterium gallinarum]
MTMTAVLTDFARSLARHGYPADPGRLHTAVAGLGALGTIERQHVYTVTRAAWCTTAEQWADFSIHFERFFSRHPAAAAPPDTDVEIDVPEALPGDDDTETGHPEPQAAAASKAAVLRETDIAELLESDAADARAQLAGLRLSPPQRRRPRYRRGRADRLHVRQALRELLATGEITSLPTQERREVPRPIVIVLDVSASMQPFHTTQLAFAAAAAEGGQHVSVFTAGTALTDVTAGVRTARPGTRSGQIPDLGGGTRLGETLQQLLDRHAGRLRGATLIVMSDGWEDGDTDALTTAAARASRLCARFLWVNPRAGRTGWQPDIRGIRAIRPHVDALLPGTTISDYFRLAAVVAG